MKIRHYASATVSVEIVVEVPDDYEGTDDMGSRAAAKSKKFADFRARYGLGLSEVQWESEDAPDDFPADVKVTP